HLPDLVLGTGARAADAGRTQLLWGEAGLGQPAAQGAGRGQGARADVREPHKLGVAAVGPPAGVEAAQGQGQLEQLAETGSAGPPAALVACRGGLAGLAETGDEEANGTGRTADEGGDALGGQAGLGVAPDTLAHVQGYGRHGGPSVTGLSSPAIVPPAPANLSARFRPHNILRGNSIVPPADGAAEPGASACPYTPSAHNTACFINLR